MRLEEAIEEFSFFYEGDYITRGMSEAKDIVLDELKKKDIEIKKLEQENQFLKMMYRGTEEFKSIEKLANSQED